MFDAGTRQLRFPGNAREACGFDCLLPLSEATRGHRLVGGHPIPFDANVLDFNVELRKRFGHLFASSARMLERMTQRGGRIDCGKHFAPSGLDVSFETLDGPMSRFVRV
jgi:hypothetical protein